MEFQTFYLELVDSTAMIRSLLVGITTDEARRKPDADSWSILETLCHLYDEEREDFRQRLDLLLHHPGTQWPAIDPEGWVMDRRYNERELSDMKEKFFAERNRSLDWLKGLEGANWDAAYSAPVGKLTAADLLASWVAHDNLAIRQLVELRRARLEVMCKPYQIGYAGEW
jgi:hypothetical protein